MQTLLRLYFYDPRYCGCQEQELLIRYDSERVATPLDDTLWGQIKRALRTWRRR